MGNTYSLSIITAKIESFSSYFFFITRTHLWCIYWLWSINLVFRCINVFSLISCRNFLAWFIMSTSEKWVSFVDQTEQSRKYQDFRLSHHSRVLSYFHTILIPLLSNINAYRCVSRLSQIHLTYDLAQINFFLL